jgi:CRISPR-associated protein Cmr1
MVTDSLDIKLKAITPIWTGGVNQKGDSLHNTGIIGSLRWWYEAIVRGLGTYACDQTEGDCKLEGNETSDAGRKSKICPVCYLFGCTGWQRKFRLEMRTDNAGKAGKIKTSAIQADEEFWLRLISLKPIDPVEMVLLRATLLISAQYGAIGGRTVFKPSEELWKNSDLPHRDYGLYEVLSVLDQYIVSRNAADEYLKSFLKKGINAPSWPNMRYFWFVRGKVLNRKQFNKIVHRSSNNSKKYSAEAEINTHQWIGGDIGKSKKIYSFHTPKAKRTWGYLKNDESQAVLLNDIVNGIKWEYGEEKKVTLGEVILNEYFQ